MLQWKCAEKPCQINTWLVNRNYTSFLYFFQGSCSSWLTGSALGAQQHKSPALNEKEVSLGCKEPAGMASAATAEGGPGTWERAGGSSLRRCTESDKLLRRSDTWAQVCRRRRSWPSNGEGEESCRERRATYAKVQRQEYDVLGPVSQLGYSDKLINDHRSSPSIAWPKPPGTSDS